MPAEPLWMALGSLLIQKQLGFSDRELVEEITENPYLQYFIGLPGYQTEPPFVPLRGCIDWHVRQRNRSAPFWGNFLEFQAHILVSTNFTNRFSGF